MDRPSWDAYFMKIAKQVARRSTCHRASVGAVVVDEKRILTTGYNGAPSGVDHCADIGCTVFEGHCQRVVHAEVNAIKQAELYRISISGCTIYSTHSPCYKCEQALIAAGIKRIVYAHTYFDPLGVTLLEEAGVTISQQLY